MKRTIYAILAATMLLLTACGSVEANETEEYEYEEEYEDGEEREYEEGEEGRYVLNIDSYKIHYTWCHSAKRMNDSNKKYVTDTVENLIDKGYSPCGNCNP